MSLFFLQCDLLKHIFLCVHSFVLEYYFESSDFFINRTANTTTTTSENAEPEPTDEESDDGMKAETEDSKKTTASDGGGGLKIFFLNTETSTAGSTPQVEGISLKLSQSLYSLRIIESIHPK